MNTLYYKGFTGSVGFSENDNVFFGKIEDIDGLVNFEGESVAELKDSFYEAVDDYIAYCEEEGVEYKKGYSGDLNLHVSPEIHSKLAVLAKKAGMSINTFVQNLLQKQIAMM